MEREQTRTIARGVRVSTRGPEGRRLPSPTPRKKKKKQKNRERERARPRDTTRARQSRQALSAWQLHLNPGAIKKPIRYDPLVLNARTCIQSYLYARGLSSAVQGLLRWSHGASSACSPRAQEGSQHSTIRPFCGWGILGSRRTILMNSCMLRSSWGLQGARLAPSGGGTLLQPTGLHPEV